MAVVIKEFIGRVPASLDSITKDTLVNTVLVPVAGFASAIAMDERSGNYLVRTANSTCVVYSLSIANTSDAVKNVNVCVLNYDISTNPLSPTPYDFFYIGKNLPVPDSSTLMVQTKTALNASQALCVIPNDADVAAGVLHVSASIASLA